MLISDENPNHKNLLYLNYIIIWYTSALFLSVCVCVCVYLCALHSQKPQKLLARYFEDLLRCSFIFFFLNSRRTGKAKKGRELFFSSRGKEAHTVWYSGRQRGVASSQSLLMLWENTQKNTKTRNYNFLKLATQNVAGDMLVSKSGFEPRGTESRRSTTPSHRNMRLRLSGTETLKRVLVVPPTKIRIWT